MTESAPFIDEYDEAAPMRRCYCRQINTQEYERQGSSTTEKALHDLLVKLDEKPEIFYNILKKKKQDEAHDGGLISFLKLQFLTWWKGKEAFDVGNEVCEKTLLKTKEDILSVFVYAQNEKGTHGRRCSQRLVEKRRKAINKSEHRDPSPTICSPLVTRAQHCLPPPPPPPPLTSSSPSPKCRSPTKAARTPLSPRNSSDFSLTRRPLRRTVNKGKQQKMLATCDLLNELKGSECRKRLRKIETMRSPGGTPIKKKPTVTDENVSIFNQKLIQKFKSLHSPSPGATSETDTEFNSPA